MKSLYNEYEAQNYEDCQKIHDIMDEAISEVVTHCLNNDISMRDAMGVCMSDVMNGFAFQILHKANKMRKAKRLDLSAKTE